MFVVEDGSGKADANSLCSVEFADAYHADRGNAGWEALTTAVKQQNLVKATDYFVGTFESLLLGSPIYTTQALPYPRVGWGVPRGIQQGIAELALVAKSTPLTPNVTRGKKKVKVGPLEVEYDGNSSVATKFVAASLKFGPFLMGKLNGISQAKLVRS